MKKIAIIPISDAGREIARTLQRTLGGKIIQRTDVGKLWKKTDAFVFIGAMGICVRTIAPYIADKHEDPAVVCVDSMGLNAIAVLSGHIGGANELADTVAASLGARAVVTTQSDNAGLWALDTLAERYDWAIASDDDMNECIYAFVNRQPTALLMEVRDEGTDYLERTLPQHVTLVDSLAEVDPAKYRLVIIVSPYNLCAPAGMLELHFVPMIGTVGFGLAHHPDDYEEIYDQIDETFSRIGVLPCYHRYCTIDVKEEEEFCAMLADEYEEEVVFYTAEQLAQVEVPNPSETVRKHVGTPSVCEAAAILGSNHGKLIIPKVKGRNWTAALAIDHQYLREKHGHIEIVGAGPGDPDLVSVRGRKMLERADLILYAGSLVPKALTTNLMLTYIRAMNNTRGSAVQTMYRLVDNKVEALEFHVEEGSRVAGKPLSQLELKENLLICCIIRDNRIIIPGGSDEIMEGDNVIVTTLNEQFSTLEDILR